MLCRRCGMESSTTDVCEWCKRPMLPAGATVSGKATRELQAERAAGSAGSPHTPDREPAEGLSAMSASEPEGEEQAESAEARESDGELAEHVLRPLNAVEPEQTPDASEPSPPPDPTSPEPTSPEPTSPEPTSPEPASPEPPTPTGPPVGEGQPAMPSHGLSEEATRTSIDISQYVGDDQSIFRPLKRAEPTAAPGGADPLARATGRRVRDEGPVSDIPENVRLGRSLAAGLVINLVLAVAQFAVTGQTQQQLYGFLQLGRSASLLVAVKYGLATGLLLGLGLGAVLTKLKRGPFLGAIVGVLVASGFGNAPWALIGGALTGILAGRFATVGLRRTISI